MSKSNKIYLDNASATPIDEGVFKVMQKITKENFANAGAIHEQGVKSEILLTQSRGDVAKKGCAG